MATVSFERSTFGIHSASGRASEKPQVPRAQAVEDMVEWEFSDAMRSRLPAGWFLLPSAVLGVLLLGALLH